MKELAGLGPPPLRLPDIDSLGWFVTAALLLLVTPGPAVVFVVERSVKSGRRAAFVSSLGLGGLVHVAAAAAGLTTAFSGRSRNQGATVRR